MRYLLDGLRRSGLHNDAIRWQENDAQEPTMLVQPIVDLATGRAVAAEALARFPSSSTLSTAEVFASAHAAGSGFELEAACVHAARALRADLPAAVHLAVNISPDALDHPGVHDALTGDVHGLIIEITEHPAAHPAALNEHLARLRGRGALVAVDDVATGYAGLMRLASLRPDIIKVDRNVVTGLTSNTAQLAVIEALVSLARRLGCLVLAEGVETIADLTTLSALDVDYAQGWAIAAPAPQFEPIASDVVAACQTARRELLRIGHPTGPAADTPAIDIHHVTAALARSYGAGTAHHTQLDNALITAADTLGADLIGVSILTEPGTLREIAATGAPIDTTEYRLTDYPATAAALHDGIMLEAHTHRPDSDPAERALLRRHNMTSLLLVPLLIDGLPAGILEISHRQHHRWTARDIAHARSLADHLTPAIQRPA